MSKPFASYGLLGYGANAAHMREERLGDWLCVLTALDAAAARQRIVIGAVKAPGRAVTQARRFRDDLIGRWIEAVGD